MEIRTGVKFQHRMLSRLLTSHILLVSIPLLLTGYLLTDTAKKSIEATILSRNLEIVMRSAEQIDETISKVDDILRLTAESPAINEGHRMSQMFTITKVVYDFEIIKRLRVLRPNGDAEVSTAYAENNGSHFSISQKAMDELRRGNPFSSEMYLSQENLPIMDVLQPIFRHGELVAVLSAEVDLKAIWSLVDRNLVGKKSEAFIIRSDGQYLAHTDRKKVIQGAYFDEERILKALAEGKSASTTYLPKSGVEEIIAYAPIASKRWGVVIAQPASEAFAASRAMRLQIFFLMIGSLGVAALIAFFYTKNILDPVDRLILGINRIAKGDLHYRIEPIGKDEISQLAQHFNTMSARLRNIQNQLKRTERLETLGKLASVLSHEIRNPLNSMVINMQILQREYKRNAGNQEKLDHYHNIVVSEIKRVDELVNNFLMIARPPKLEQEFHDIAEIIDEIITVQQPLVLPKGIRIERAYHVAGAVVRVDRNKMKQVFLNIILNAIQAMSGGGKLSIAIELAAPRDADNIQKMLRISFQDSGKGIKQEDLAQVFDFYYSTKEEGTGIGLSIAQQIVEEHGGLINISSEIGKGTEVEIFLPTTETPKAEPPPKGAKRRRKSRA